jgi:hypothetical protein
LYAIAEQRLVLEIRAAKGENDSQSVSISDLSNLNRDVHDSYNLGSE